MSSVISSHLVADTRGSFFALLLAGDGKFDLLLC